ncbi:MAG: hypothetical protein ACE5Q6_10825 [Dehalococcoidia bacterium]
MISNTQELSGFSLLGAFAHPDDDGFGSVDPAVTWCWSRSLANNRFMVFVAERHTL